MEARTKILFADDEPDILDIISFNLEKEGYEVILAKDGQQAFDLCKSTRPDLIILDVMMPYKTGIQVCNLLRQLPDFKQTPIILLTALNDEPSHIKGLDSGADDYISKPISTKILISRINALLRRTQKEQSGASIIKIGEITIDPTKYMVNLNGQDISLAKKEFELLSLLAGKPGRVFLRNEILSMVWGTEVIVGDRTIDVHIRKIRQKIGIDCIKTVKGVGYKFEW
jgi:two-component system alkaline phosphatase synthesis response regulator PhoP